MLGQPLAHSVETIGENQMRWHALIRLCKGQHIQCLHVVQRISQLLTSVSMVAQAATQPQSTSEGVWWLRAQAYWLCCQGTASLQQAWHSQLSCFVACTALCLAQACEFLRILLCGTKLHITDGLCLATAYVLSLLPMLGARQQKSICAHVFSLPNMLYIQTL